MGLGGGVGAGGVFLVAGGAGGILGEEEAEDGEALCFGIEGDHAAVEMGVAGFGVFVAALEMLVGGGVVGDLQEVFGAVEAGFGVAVAGVAPNCGQPKAPSTNAPTSTTAPAPSSPCPSPNSNAAPASTYTHREPVGVTTTPGERGVVEDVGVLEEDAAEVAAVAGGENDELGTQDHPVRLRVFLRLVVVGCARRPERS
ncbi:hypothetical protein [Streptomyces niveus]|uniref:hypothetical protein n=1 Tax=Streptomyces niveus TaxID=193462 RepID=UPI003440CC40